MICSDERLSSLMTGGSEDATNVLEKHRNMTGCCLGFVNEHLIRIFVVVVDPWLIRMFY